MKSKGKVASYYTRLAIEEDKRAARTVHREPDWAKVYAKESEQAFVRGLIAFLHLVKPRKRKAKSCQSITT